MTTETIAKTFYHETSFSIGLGSDEKFDLRKRVGFDIARILSPFTSATEISLECYRQLSDLLVSLDPVLFFSEDPTPSSLPQGDYLPFECYSRSQFKKDFPDHTCEIPFLLKAFIFSEGASTRIHRHVAPCLTVNKLGYCEEALWSLAMGHTSSNGLQQVVRRCVELQVENDVRLDNIYETKGLYIHSLKSKDPRGCYRLHLYLGGEGSPNDAELYDATSIKEILSKPGWDPSTPIELSPSLA